jgi:Trk-type K+ transport systems, membrane components
MVEGKPLSETAAFGAMVFIFTYIAIICVGAIINLSTGMGITESWTASIACMGNVGPGMGTIGSMSNYADVPSVAKCSSMALMLLGRLEIFPLLYVITWKWTRK